MKINCEYRKVLSVRSSPFQEHKIMIIDAFMFSSQLELNVTTLCCAFTHKYMSFFILASCLVLKLSDRLHVVEKPLLYGITKCSKLTIKKHTNKNIQTYFQYLTHTHERVETRAYESRIWPAPLPVSISHYRHGGMMGMEIIMDV